MSRHIAAMVAVGAAIVGVVSGCGVDTTNPEPQTLDLNPTCSGEDIPVLDLRSPLRETWHLDASAVVPGWELTDPSAVIDTDARSRDAGDAAMGRRPVLCGHTFVVAAPTSSGEQPRREQTIAGVNIDTGTVSFRAQLPARARCARLGERFGCVATLPEGVAVRVYAPESGDVQQQWLPAADAAIPTRTGIITATGSTGNHAQVTKYSTDGSAAWSSEAHVGASSSEFDDITVRSIGPDFLLVSRAFGPSATVLAARTGKIVTEIPRQSNNFAAGAFPRRQVLAQAADGVIVVDESGNITRRHQDVGLVAVGGWQHVKATDGAAQIYELTDGLYDVADGRKLPLPEHPRIPGQPTSPPYVADQSTVIGRMVHFTARSTNSYAALPDPRAAGFDAFTGTVKWVYPHADQLGTSAGVAVGTVALMVSATGNGTILKSFDMATGQTLWERGLSPGEYSTVQTGGRFDLDAYGLNLSEFGISRWSPG